MDWTRLVPFLFNMGSEFFGRAYCTFCPYVGGIQTCGAYCGVLGAGCWNLVEGEGNAHFQTYVMNDDRGQQCHI